MFGVAEFWMYIGFGLMLGSGFFYPLAVGKLIATALKEH